MLIAIPVVAALAKPRRGRRVFIGTGRRGESVAAIAGALAERHPE